jgi:hypothetical protein
MERETMMREAISRVENKKAGSPETRSFTPFPFGLRDRQDRVEGVEARGEKYLSRK